MQVVAVVAAWSLQLVAAWSLELVAGWSLQLVAGWSLGKGLLIDAVLVVLVGEARCAVIHLAPLQNSLQVAVCRIFADLVVIVPYGCKAVTTHSL